MNTDQKRKLKRHGRKRRTLGRTLLTLGLLVAGVWVASGWWSVGFDKGIRSTVLCAHVMDGCCTVMLFDTYPSFRSNWSVTKAEVPQIDSDPGPPFLPGFPRVWVWEARWSNNWASAATYVRFPVWFVSLLAVTPAALLLRSGILARRRAITGKCKSCGYDLAGLPPAADSPCPECGKGKES